MRVLDAWKRRGSAGRRLGRVHGIWPTPATLRRWTLSPAGYGFGVAPAHAHAAGTLSLDGQAVASSQGGFM